MSGLIKRVIEFIVFRNIFIAIATACLVAETRFLSGKAWCTIDALIAFTFFSTFLVYNFHSFSNDPEHEFSVPQLFKDFVNPAISLEQRVCVGVGIIGTGVAFLFLQLKVMLFLLPVGLITLAYSLPVFKLQNRLHSLRDIIYVKIFTVAVVWAVATTLLSYINDGKNISIGHLFLLFSERLLFIYAITITFEIRDRHSEAAIGNRTIPTVYGVAKSKMLGYVVLVAYCILVLIREYFYESSFREVEKQALALFFSAFSAALLIAKTIDARGRWFYKFLIDGTMIEQFLLLILVQNLC